LRRELSKKLSEGAWEECEKLLVDLQILRKGGGSTVESYTTNDTLTERDDTRIDAKERSKKAPPTDEDSDEDDDDEEDARPIKKKVDNNDKV